MVPPSSHSLATPRGGRPPAARQSRFRGGKLGRVLFGVLASALHIASPAQTANTVRLANVFNDHMVLQRNQPIPVWGWAPAGSTVQVRVGPRSANGQAAADGRFRVTLAALPAGGPFVLSLRADAEPALTVSDVMVGDVWLAGGQSNMVWPLKDAQDGAAAVAAANEPLIRHLRLPNTTALLPAEDTPAAAWQTATPQTAGDFSAVGWHFAMRWQTAHPGVAVGLINTAWNGSHLETWLRREAALLHPDLADAVNALPANDLAAYNKRVRTALDAAGVGWQATANYAPTLAHNALHAPLQGLPLRGVLWYQGESNISRAARYEGLFQRFIQDWRSSWNQPDLPFFWVQLAAHRPLRDNNPNRSPWAELREAQRAALVLPHTGMAVATDVGDAGDIHPRRKREVGERLAALALHDEDSKLAAATGPQMLGVKAEGGTLVSRWGNTAGGLRARPAGTELLGFFIAGADGQFVAAQARINGDTITLSSAEVNAPQFLRYGWIDNPEQANLVDGNGLPASPVRSDPLPLATRDTRYPK
jgi:sialate O-acetylesterase